jgi:hypothetical protein
MPLTEAQVLMLNLLCELKIQGLAEGTATYQEYTGADALSHRGGR